jgi:hypothetical protein
MSSRLGARLAALLVPATLLLPVAAHAETVTVDDPAGDAKALNLASELGLFFGGGGDSDQPLFLDAPAEVATDVTRTTITHAKRVTVTTSFRDLVDGVDHSLAMRVITPEGRYDLSVARSTDGSKFVDLTSRAAVVTDSGDVRRPRPCRSVRGRYDVVAETVTVSFPAACIDDPRWIQVTSGATRFQVTPVGDGSINLAGFADDAFRTSLSENGMARSPKVRRG